MGCTTNTVHYPMRHTFDILSSPFNRILMLIVWLRLPVLALVHPKDIFHGGRGF